MEDNLKVTATNDERNYTEIFSGESIVNIPLFQREYKWTEKNLDDFWRDVEQIIDGEKSSQFLGVIVTVPRPRSMGAPQIYDIVDGQQRLFTCHLAIAAAVRAALDHGQINWAIDVAKSLLVMRRSSTVPSNIKVVPSAKDRQQFNIIWSEIANHPGLKNTDGWGSDSFPTPPSPSGADSGALGKQYKRILSKLKGVLSKSGFDSFVIYANVIATKLSFVTISLRDPIAAPIIFERLNSRGQKITTTDLVRNEVFSRDASDPTKAAAVFSNYWEPFQKKYDERSIDIGSLLFPYALTFDTRTTKADLFSKLRGHWGEMSDTSEIIAEMDRYSSTLFALERGDILSDLPKSVRGNLVRFQKLGAPSSIYPFVFEAVQAIKSETQDEDEVIASLDMIESFLVRRATCGIEPTGLHAVFKGMWRDILDDTNFEGRVSPNAVKAQIDKRTTVAWPNTDRFKEALVSDPIYRRRICKFLILQREISSEGETPLDDFWIEHVLPDKFHSKNWGASFSENEHSELKHTIGNLIPLTSEMNQSESQNPYHKKQQAFRKSIFATTRDFSEQYEGWNPDLLADRSRKFADWAATRWPF